MTIKLITVEELQNKIKCIERAIEQEQERITLLQGKITSNKSMKSTYQRNIHKAYTEITKMSNQIEQLEYQISVGCRKLKTSIMVTKDLILAGFKKGEYIASGQVKGWGKWYGEFTVSNEPTKLFINWLTKSNERFDKFYEYLVEKYGKDVYKDEYKNVTIMK